MENAHSETRFAELSSKLEAVNKRREELTKEMVGLMEQKQSYEEQIKVVSGELAVAGERIAEVDAEISKARATRPPRHPIPKSPDSCAARRTQHAAILAYDIISLSRTTTLSEELVSVIIDVKQGSRVAPPLTEDAERQGFGEAVYVNERVRVRVLLPTLTLSNFQTNARAFAGGRVPYRFEVQGARVRNSPPHRTAQRNPHRTASSQGRTGNFIVQKIATNEVYICNFSELRFGA